MYLGIMICKARSCLSLFLLNSNQRLHLNNSLLFPASVSSFSCILRFFCGFLCNNTLLHLVAPLYDNAIVKLKKRKKKSQSGEEHDEITGRTIS